MATVGGGNLTRGGLHRGDEGDIPRKNFKV